MSTQNKSSFGPRLKAFRKSHKLSGGEVEKLTGIKQPMISRWETGDAEPSIANVLRISRSLGVSADYLLGLSDDENPAPASVSASGDNAVAAGRDATVSSDAAESARLRARNAELEAQIARMTDAVTQLSTRLAALSAAITAEERRRTENIISFFIVLPFPCVVLLKNQIT